jgi:hypothetical protein
VIVGGVAILLGALGGFVLGFSQEPFFEGGFYTMPYGRFFLRGAHTHGMPFALYSLIIGLMLDRLVLTEKWKKYCSLLVVLAFVMPIGLILRGATGGATTFAPVVLLGALCFLASIVIVIKGAVSTEIAWDGSS